MFSDELSKELYRLRVNWLMTGKHEYIEKIVELSHPEFPVWNSRDEKENSFLWSGYFCRKAVTIFGGIVFKFCVL